MSVSLATQALVLRETVQVSDSDIHTCISTHIRAWHLSVPSHWVSCDASYFSMQTLGWMHLNPSVTLPLPN